jgi:hypothetical protein
MHHNGRQDLLSKPVAPIASTLSIDDAAHAVSLHSLDLRWGRTASRSDQVIANEVID